MYNVTGLTKRVSLPLSNSFWNIFKYLKILKDFMVSVEISLYMH